MSFNKFSQLVFQGMYGGQFGEFVCGYWSLNLGKFDHEPPLAANFVFCFCFVLFCFFCWWPTRFPSRLRGLIFCMGKPEIPVGITNGSRHSVWEASENLGFDLR